MKVSSLQDVIHQHTFVSRIVLEAYGVEYRRCSYNGVLIQLNIQLSRPWVLRARSLLPGLFSAWFWQESLQDSKDSVTRRCKVSRLCVGALR